MTLRPHSKQGRTASGLLATFIAGVLACVQPVLNAAAEPILESASDGRTALFGAHDILDVELRGPVDALIKNRSGRSFRFEMTEGAIQQSVNVTTGGKSRRDVCDFLPLRLDFSSGAITEHQDPVSVFSGQNFFYLTTHCRYTSRSQADLIEEYLAYRILNLITDFSYRVRLLRVRYVDTEQAGMAMTHYAFAIESQYALAQRLGGEVLEIEQLPKRRLNEDHAALIYIFQYLIGNTDWSLVAATGARHCCHNGQLIGIGPEIFYVPFDFDLAGLVNTRYAYPDGSLPIKRVTHRLYRGYCGPEDALQRALDHILSRREAILDLYRQVPVLSEKDREKGLRYLTRFSDRARRPEKLLAMFQRSCLG